jgi:hypothetical protein
MEICGGVKCVYCGCSDIRLLEVNHKNGGGNQERYGTRKRKREMGQGYSFYLDIIMGRRKTDDLEVVCKPNNSVHYLELIYPDVKGHFKVIWTD